MIRKLGVDCSESDRIQFVHDWVKLCASGKTVEAFDLLDSPLDTTRHTWTPEDFREVTFDHFDDEKFPTVTDPETVEGTIRKDTFEYNDGSGLGLEFDLPLNGIVNDFTLMFDFIKVGGELKVIMDDCHVM